MFCVFVCVRVHVHECICLHMCVYLCMCGCVGVSTWLSSAWAGQSLICYPLRWTDMQPNQTGIKTERKASLCSSAVQFVLTLSGALSSPLILMSSPGIRLWRPASQWGTGVGGVGGVTSIHPHKHTNITPTSAHRHKLVWAGKCWKILHPLLTRNSLKEKYFSAYQSWRCTSTFLKSIFKK